MRVDTTQFEEVFVVEVRERVKELPREARQLTDKTAADAAGIAQINAPVDTGNHRSQIRPVMGVVDRGGVYADDVVAGADYSAALEFGHIEYVYGRKTGRIRPPRPHVIPALDAVTPSYVAALELLFSDRLLP